MPETSQVTTAPSFRTPRRKQSLDLMGLNFGSTKVSFQGPKSHCGETAGVSRVRTVCTPWRKPGIGRDATAAGALSRSGGWDSGLGAQYLRFLRLVRGVDFWGGLGCLKTQSTCIILRTLSPETFKTPKPEPPKPETSTPNSAPALSKPSGPQIPACSACPQAQGWGFSVSG